MINVLCFLTVTVMAPLTNKISVPVMIQDQVRGVVVSEDNDMYVVDFSKDAQEKKYVGDYRQRPILKSMCAELETGVASK